MYAEFDLVMPTSLNELTAVFADTKASEHIPITQITAPVL
jgi:hypothetical protein